MARASVGRLGVPDVLAGEVPGVRHESTGLLPTRAPDRTLATFDGSARAIRCALALVAELGTQGHKLAGAVHSGECELDPHGPRGVAADLAEQLAASTPPGQVLVTQTVRDLVVGSTIQLEPRDKRSFQGIPGRWDILVVTSADR